uniref:Uncharacterized protein n=1 Tax=Tetranychus urticae TaxID=32264 RepID=T1JYK8_TETUR
MIRFELSFLHIRSIELRVSPFNTRELSHLMFQLLLFCIDLLGPNLETEPSRGSHKRSKKLMMLWPFVNNNWIITLFDTQEPLSCKVVCFATINAKLSLASLVRNYQLFPNDKTPSKIELLIGSVIKTAKTLTLEIKPRYNDIIELLFCESFFFLGGLVDG